MESMTKLCVFLTILSICTLASTPSWPKGADTGLEVVFQTQHGELKFVNEDGDTNDLAVDVRLNGKAILTSSNRVDSSGFPQHLMTSVFVTPYQLGKDSKVTDRPRRIDRIIVSEGPDGNCIHDFIMLDFTGSKPFVSQRFGVEDDGNTCLTLQKIKWGKETLIYLEGPLKFIYHFGGQVVGPVQ